VVFCKWFFAAFIPSNIDFDFHPHFTSPNLMGLLRRTSLFSILLWLWFQ